VAAGPSTGFYVEVSPRGVRTGAGFYRADPPQLAAYRAAVAHDLTGGQLDEIVTGLRADGWDVGGDRLKTSPRGYDTDHPRIDLLRHRSLNAGRSLGFEPVIHSPELLDRVRDDWRALRPLVTWLAANCRARAEG
jgi:uncharacterized protein (DUF2461 family)